MLKIFHRKSTNSYFVLTSFDRFKEHEMDDTYRILWVKKGELKLLVDMVACTVRENEVLTLAPNQHVELLSQAEGCAFQYNREFYCILDHDKEVSCAGLLYYGLLDIPIIQLDARHQRKLQLLLEVFLDEFDTMDTIQEDMLQILLKRLIIICTRLLKEQWDVTYDDQELDLIRQFRVLVEQNFREKQKVADYAALLHKSPKTLANLFSNEKEKSPLKQIHERITLEAKRLLAYSDKSIKEIGYDLMFEEEAHFSRFFKEMQASRLRLFVWRCRRRQERPDLQNDQSEQE